MMQRHRHLRTAAALLGGLVLSACAVTPPDSPPAGATPAAAAARSDNTIAGTRLPVATTDRMVKQIGNAGAREMSRDKPPNPGTPSN